MSHIHDEINAYEEEKEKAKEKCEGYQKTLDQIRQMEEKISYKVNDFQVATTKEDAFRKNLNVDMTEYSIEDLNNMLLAYDREMQGDERKLEEAKREVQRIEGIIVQAKDDNLKMSGEKGLLLGEKKIYDENLNQRIILMEGMAIKYGLELSFSQTQQTVDAMSTQSRLDSDMVNDMMLSQGTTTSAITITIEDLDAFSRSVRNKGNELQHDLRSYKMQAQKEYDELQAAISDTKAKKSSLESGMEYIYIWINVSSTFTTLLLITAF